ncbi:MAG TPA: DUF4129 domain-containing protein [Candidatus Saccharimonadales bacterium]|jgi:hypothetical protein|nr:DUF4129 domain-containing protein [Candidatus Saccharimonadales bacterium]
MRPDRIPILNSLFPRGAWILAAILCVFVGVPVSAAPADAPAQTPSPTIYDPQAFIQKLGQLKAGLDAASGSTETLRAYRESLPTSWIVDTGKRHFVVPTDLLVSQLAKAEMQPEIRTITVKQALDYLDALASETVSASAQAQESASPDSAREKLNAILSRPEYAHAIRESWWDKIRRQIDEMLLETTKRIFSAVGSQESLGYILLWIGVGAAAVFIAYSIFRRWIRTAKGEEMALQAAAVPLRSWQEWVYAARESAARADYRMAIHCAYWAGIARLQELGALSADRSKTPREYLSALAKSKMIVPETLATRQQALHRLTSRLEKMWYGYQVATEADFRDSLTQLETLGCHLP